MKFERLTDTKIRITLTLKEIQDNNISNEAIFTNSNHSQRLLQLMLNEAKEKIGFKTNDSKLLVEALAVSEQEYTFIITKLETTDIEKINKFFIFRFDSFDNFIDLCIFLSNISDLNLKEFSKNFSLLLYNNTYYLCNSDPQSYPVLLDYMKNVFSEFATPVNDLSYIEGSLNEYGKTIFENNAIVNCIFHFI